MSSQYGELRLTSGWDRFGCLGHPRKFQRFSRLGFVTARHLSSGRQPNFAALNRGRHLCSAWRPSRWALAHILVCCVFCPAATVTEEFHYDLAYTTEESRSDVEPSVAIQLLQQHRDPTSGLVCLAFNVVYAPFKVMTYVLDSRQD